MKRSPIHRNSCFLRGLAAILCLQLSLPNAALALRPELDRGGLEEILKVPAELSAAELSDIVRKLTESARGFGVTIPSNARIHLFITGGTSGRSHPMVNEILSTLTQQKKSPAPYAYLPYVIQTGDISEFRTILRAVRQGIRFPNGAEVVTASAGAPFKTEGRDLSSGRDPRFAVTPGAEMFVRRLDGQLWSTMIDAAATADWFEENIGPLKGLRVVVLGLGGVGSVFVDELESRGVAEVTAAEPDPKKAEEVRRHARRSGFTLSVVGPDDPSAGTVSTVLHEKITQADVVFNMTGLGKPVSDKPFSPLVNHSDQPLRYKEGAVVVDLNYFLRDQNFLTQAREVTPSVRVENGAGISNYSIMGILEILFRETADIALPRAELNELVTEAARRHGLLPAAGLEEVMDELEDIPFEPAWLVSSSVLEAEQIQDAVEADAQSRRQPMVFPKWSRWKLEHITGDRVGVFAKDPQTGQLLGFIVYGWQRDIEEEDLRSVQFEILNLAVLPEGREKRADHWLINRVSETAQRKFGAYRGVPVDVRVDLHPDAHEAQELFVDRMEFQSSGWQDSSSVQDNKPAFRVHLPFAIAAGLEEEFVSQDAKTSKRLRTEFQAGQMEADKFVDAVLAPFHAVPEPPPGLAVAGYSPLGVPVDETWIPILQRFSEGEIVRATSREAVRGKAREAVEEFLSRIDGEVVPGRPLRGMPDNVAIEMMLELMRVATGTMDPYAALKQEYNELALAHLNEMGDMVTASDNPVQTAIALGIIGNAIDFAAAEQRAVLERDGFAFQKEVQRAPKLPFVLDQRSDFLAALEAHPTGEVLFLIDNAAEIVFDLPLIKLLLQQGRRVMVAGKSLPHANDMTADDLRALFADPRVQRFLGPGRKANQLWVIASGSAMTGLDLRRATPELAAAWRRAPIIYAKGQGMIETLRYSPLLRDVFHAVMVKDSRYFHEMGPNSQELPLKRGDVLFLHTLAAGLEENPSQPSRFNRRTLLKAAGVAAAATGLGTWWLTRNSERFLEPGEVPEPWKQLFQRPEGATPLLYLGEDYLRFEISSRHFFSGYRAFDPAGEELGDVDATHGDYQRIVDPRSGETLGFYKKVIQWQPNFGVQRFSLRNRAAQDVETVTDYPYVDKKPLLGVPEEWRNPSDLQGAPRRPFYRVLKNAEGQWDRVELIGFVEEHPDRPGLLLDRDGRRIARLEPINVVDGPQDMKTFEIPARALVSVVSRNRRYFEEPPSESLTDELKQMLDQFQPATLNGRKAKFQLAHRWVQLQVLLGKRTVAVDPRKARETGEALVKRSTAEVKDFKDPQVRRLLWDAIANIHPWFAMAREAADHLGWEEDPEILQYVLSQIQQWWIRLENSRLNALADGDGQMTNLTKDLLEEVLFYNGYQTLDDVADGFKTFLGGSARLSREFLYIDRPKGSDPALAPLSLMQARLRGFHNVSDVQILLHQAVALQRLGYEVSFLSYVPVVNGLEQEEPVKTLSHEWVVMATHPDHSKEAVLFGTHREFLKRFGEETSPGVMRVTRERILEVNQGLPPGFYLSMEEYSLFPLDASTYLKVRDQALKRRKDSASSAELLGPGLGLAVESEGELHPQFEQDLAAVYVKTMAQRFDEIVKETGIKVVTNGLTGSELEIRKAGWGAALGLIPRKLVKDLEKIVFLRETKIFRFREARVEKGRVVWENVDLEAEGTYSGKTIESVKGVSTPVHEIAHHWDVHITNQVHDWRGDLSELFHQISWQSNGRGSWALRKTIDVDIRDFAGRGHGLANEREDIAVNGERYVMDGAVFRADARAAMGEGNYAPAVKYLFAKYLLFLDTDGTSFEYSVGDHSPSITWSEVAAAIRTDAEGLNPKPEAKRLGALVERMHEVWQKERESNSIVQNAPNGPLIAAAGLEEPNQKARALEQAVTRAEEAVDQGQWRALEQAAFALVPLQGQAVSAEIGGRNGEMWDRLNLLVRRLQEFKIVNALGNSEDPRIQRWQVEAVALLFSADRLYAETVNAILPDTSISGAYLWATLYQRWGNRSPSRELVPLMDAMVVLFNVSPQERGFHWKEVEESKKSARNGLVGFLTSAESISRDELDDRRAAEMWWVYSQALWDETTAPVPDDLRRNFLLRNPDAIENLSVLYQRFIGSMADALGFSGTAAAQQAISEQRWASLENRSSIPLWEPPLDNSTFREHMGQMEQGIVEGDWGLVSRKAGRLRVLSAGLVQRGAWENRKDFQRLEEILSRIQTGKRPTDPDQRRAVRLWEANALALLAAVSTSDVRLYPSVTAERFLVDSGSLEGEFWKLLYSFSRFMSPPDGLFTDLSHLEAIEFLIWSAPNERFLIPLDQLPLSAQTPGIQALADSIRSVPGQLASSSRPIGTEVHKELLEALSGLAKNPGPPPLLLRHRFLMDSDQKTLDLRTFRAQVLSKLADQIGWYREGEKWQAWDPRSDSAAGLEEARRFDTVEAFLEAYPMVRPQMPYVVSPQLVRDQMGAWAVPASARDADDADVTVDVYVYAGETLEQLEWLKAVERQLNRAADRIGGVSFAIKSYPHDGAIEPIRPTVVIQKEGLNLPAAPKEPLPVITIRELTEVTRLMPGWVYAVALHENLRGQVIGPVVGVTLFEDEAGKLVFGVFV